MVKLRGGDGGELWRHEVTDHNGVLHDGSILIRVAVFNFVLVEKFEKKWLWGISGKPSAQGSPAPGSAGDPAQNGAALS